MSFIIGIDASRCKSGGAIAHLVGIIENFDKSKFDNLELHIWGYEKLLNLIPDLDFIKKHNSLFLNLNLPFQIFWQFFVLPFSLKINKCQILFTADAASVCLFFPQVVLSQDILSYDKVVFNKYNFGLHKIRLYLIFFLQNLSFKRAIGVIFLSDYAKKIIEDKVGIISNSIVVPHGVNPIFKNKIDFDFKSVNQTIFNCVYVSNALLYKFNWTVIEAIEILRIKGFDVRLSLVGGVHSEVEELINFQLLKSDPNKEFVKLYSFLNQNEVLSIIQNSDVFVFASACEAFGITLLEGMSLGMPIACSNKSSLPGLLEDGGIYFDPEDSEDIANAIFNLIVSPELRKTLGEKAFEISKKYSWERCSKETFQFLINNIKSIHQSNE